MRFEADEYKVNSFLSRIKIHEGDHWTVSGIRTDSTSWNSWIVKVSELVYALKKGEPVPDGYRLRQVCDFALCANPEHQEMVRKRIDHSKDPVEELKSRVVKIEGNHWRISGIRGIQILWKDRGLQSLNKVLYEIYIDKLPPGAKVRRWCDDPRCVSPYHTNRFVQSLEIGKVE